MNKDYFKEYFNLPQDNNEQTLNCIYTIFNSILGMDKYDSRSLDSTHRVDGPIQIENVIAVIEAICLDHNSFGHKSKSIKENVYCFSLSLNSEKLDGIKKRILNMFNTIITKNRDFPDAFQYLTEDIMTLNFVQFFVPVSLFPYDYNKGQLSKSFENFYQVVDIEDLKANR